MVPWYSHISADTPSLCCVLRAFRRRLRRSRRGVHQDGKFLDSLSREVALRVVPNRIKDERLAEEHLDFIVRPILCW